MAHRKSASQVSDGTASQTILGASISLGQPQAADSRDAVTERRVGGNLSSRSVTCGQIDSGGGSPFGGIRKASPSVMLQTLHRATDVADAC